MNIWLDCDGVLCDLASAVVREYNRMAGKLISVDDVLNYDWTPAMTADQARNIYQRPDFWRQCDGYAGAEDFLIRLQGIGRVVILSDCFYGGFDEKAKWLKDSHLDHAPFALCNYKRNLVRHGDVVVDDSPYNLKYAKSIGAHPVCINMPWNQPTSNPAWTGPRYDFDGAVQAVKQLTKGE